MCLLQQHLHGQSEVVFRDPILLDMSAQQMIQPFVPHMLLIRMCEGDFFFFPLLIVERGFKQMESPVFMQSNYFVLS